MDASRAARTWSAASTSSPTRCSSCSAARTSASSCSRSPPSDVPHPPARRAPRRPAPHPIVSDDARPSPDGPHALPAAALAAWLEQSHNLLATTDRDGVLAWADTRFVAATGLAPGTPLLALAPDEAPWVAARNALQGALAAGTLADADLELRSAGGGSLWVRARACTHDGCMLWTLQD